MKPLVYCITCGSVGPPQTVTPGSFLVELLLWCLFIVPGLIYSFWRLSRRHPACGQCGSESIMPADTPKAQAAIHAH